MRRPFFAVQMPPAVAGVSRAIGSARVASATRLRGVGRSFNPLDGVPHPLPNRRPRSLAVGEDATPDQERAMRNFWWDGFFAETAEVIWLQFFAIYALALGAGVGLIGILVAVSNLMAALSVWPGALLAEKTKRYKFICVFTAGGLGRLIFLGMAVIPWVATGHWALAAICLLAPLRAMLSAIAMPAWQAFAGEFVPQRLRGRYFASRNFAKQFAELGTAPLAGLVISIAAGFSGWQIVWITAFLFGITSTAFYLRIPSVAQPVKDPPAAPSPAPLRASALRDRRLVGLIASSGVFYMAVMIGGPFFSIYLVRELGGSALWVGITTSAMPLAGMMAQPFLGRLHDRLGPKRLLLASGALFPIVPWLWLIATAPWHIFFLNLFAGALWSANLLASLNLLLAIAPEHKRPTYAAFHQAAIFLGSFAGPLIGGALIPLVGFKMIFFLSGVGRGLAMVVLWRFVPAEDEALAVEVPAPAPVPERFPPPRGPVTKRSLPPPGPVPEPAPSAAS